MSTFIKRNTPIPARATKMFSTNADNQTEVEVSVYEGERLEVKNNNLLAKFDLEGIIPAAAGIARIEVVFDLDANGILNVTASDKQSNREVKTEISNSCRLSKEEVEAMVEDAKKFRSVDKEAKERMNLKLQLKAEMKDIRDTIDDPKFRINKPDYDEIERALEWLDQWFGGAEKAKPEEYKEQLRLLGEMVNPILTKLFKGQGLAARNMGLLFKRKRKIDMMITNQTQEYLQLKNEMNKRHHTE